MVGGIFERGSTARSSSWLDPHAVSAPIHTERTPTSTTKEGSGLCRIGAGINLRQWQANFLLEWG